MPALQGSFGTVLVRGIFAGWLIALMVWLLPAADSARLHVIIIITYVVGLASLSHTVAGSVEVFYLDSTGAASHLLIAIGSVRLRCRGLTCKS
ncbi:MAG: formate/nitrite transporter family protein [Dehalococcoidia bacterium]